MILDTLCFFFDEIGGDLGGGDAGGGGAPSAAPPEVPAPSPGDGGTEGETGSDEATGEVQPPAFTPDFKFKVAGADKEIPEWARPFITNAEAQKQFKDLFERSEGLDHVKQSRETLATQLETVKTEHASLTGTIQNLSSMVRRGDMEGFFEALQIPEVEVLKYAMRRLQYREATPEQRAAYDEWRGQMSRLATAEMENANLRSTFQTQSVQTRERELDIALAGPEVLSVANAFDTRLGRPGSFRAEVINRGKFHAMQGRDISVGDAIKEVLALIGPPPAAAPAPGAVAAGGAGGTQGAPKAPDKKPVIPNIAGNGSSPTRVVPKSIKQLREMGQKMAAAQ